MSGVSNLGKALTVVFVFALLALLLELLYVLWRRRFLFPRRRDPPQTTVDQLEVSTPSPNSVSFLSKNDLLYLLCYRNQSRVEPHGSDPTRSAEGSLPVDDDEMEIVDLYKLSEMFGFRVLPDPIRNPLDRVRVLEFGFFSGSGRVRVLSENPGLDLDFGKTRFDPTRCHPYP